MKAEYICPVVTMMDETGRLDPVEQEKVLDNLIRNDIDGILGLGSIGEFFSLTVEQKMAFLDSTLRFVDGRKPVYAGCASMVRDETVMLARYALEKGAAAAVIISPFYFTLGQEDIIKYYSDLAFDIPGDVILYNFPQRTGYCIAPETAARLAESCEHIVGIKDTIPGMDNTRDMIRLCKAARPDFRVYSGFDDNLAHNVLSGGDGCIAGISNFAPDLATAFRDALRADDMALTAKYQAMFNGLMSIYGVTTPFVAAIKTAMCLRGIASSPDVIFPFTRSNEQETQKVREILVKYGLLSEDKGC